MTINNMKLDIKRTITEKLTPKEIISYILADRGLDTDVDFFSPPHPKTIEFASFFKRREFKKNLATSLKILEEVKKQNKKIVVYCDYDADGITGGAILWETLHLLGFDATAHVPDRRTEGYGFSKVGLDLVREKYDPGLIISVDHGIMGHTQIDYAKSLGIPVIITDHHSKADEDPKSALAIFHTDKLSGSGVAYFFARELFENLKPLTTNYQLLSTNFDGDYLAFATIGIIADLVPLMGPARAVVFHGLKALSKTKRIGLTHLLLDAGIAGQEISPYEVGFVIAPRINAFGRLEQAVDALRLLCTSQELRAAALAKKSGEVNRTRQQMVEGAVEEAIELVNTKQKIIVVTSHSWNEGIIGLIASKLVEKFARPAIVITISDGQSKASARSISGFNITTFLREFSDQLLSVGGHAAAAGFSMPSENVKTLQSLIEDRGAQLLTDEQLVKTTIVDLAIPFESNTLALAHEIEKCAPFGIGNPAPTFFTQGQILDVQRIGKTKDHLKLYLTGEKSLPVEFVFFGEGAREENLKKGDMVEVVYKLEIDRWGGREKLKGMGKVLV
ncbi:single-stranded-DNA-specific exonuclease RecJ [Candidatus Roizmanbacteria bacterium RIFCSPHIGHO2_02_FULL_40_13b]|uniref:Single-stranded-DNA-specific exonuclease RecJ n=1 Tax=Candidatus Roizmanbacteria bacterium RIFCSPHIGHO2_01_FULL_39_24 TaxID=1802032 RepID=A0A1F7GLX5_9BACT|nr:MAG: single-stranded-DNA-specific exonuclease RecJ [Candidatus Roizmanbacteria bacterium RIFCSPHIGHO2_01_FULL_39_24]OGK27937.1 MAG: single-stranded-DNA-specific exonuclease RecJ [Candidatus Roizmanbacteria bacterium RIFCSPHIGHO2_02_FULL_40_13b]OGK50068.1 MAG: single-stranded-DNA-specific exonuclease RecJ [Candidatus Roizmanbacteria bacterium RIFCSPLOWO2_01_FULL_40_32]